MSLSLLPPPTFIFPPTKTDSCGIQFLFLKRSLELQSTMKIAKFLLPLLPLAELSLASRQQHQQGKQNCSSTGIVPADLLAGLTGLVFVSRTLWLETLHANSHTAAKTGDVSPCVLPPLQAQNFVKASCPKKIKEAQADDLSAFDATRTSSGTYLLGPTPSSCTP